MDTTDQPPRLCPVCRGTVADPYLTKANQRLVECRRCRMVYASPLPRSLSLTNYYTSRGAYYLSPEKVRGDFSIARYRREARLLHRLAPSGVLLDVGCSTGAFLHDVRVRYPGCYQARGIDVNEPAVAHARSLGLDVHCGEFLDAPLADAAFDAITFWAVMEHLLDPAAYLHRASQLLRPGGWCFILVPNLNSLAVRLLGRRYRYFMEEHINWFSSATLRGFMGLEPALRLRYLRTSHFNPLVIIQDARRPREAVPEAERAALLKRTTLWKERPALWPLRVGYGLCEWCLARFGLADNLVAVARKNAPSTSP